MAKLTKKELKGILKECLKEILHEEGILLAENRMVHGQENNSEENTEVRRNNFAKTRLFEQVNSVANSFSSKDETDLMRKIFQDTAITTLQKQEANGHSVGLQGVSVPILSEEASNHQNLEDKKQLSNLSMDGDISRWAKVAFANSNKN